MKTVITMASWFYKKAQTNAQQYNFTLVWSYGFLYTSTGKYVGSAREDVVNLEDDDVIEVYNLIGNVTRETEKAVLLECDYWNLRRGHRDISSVPRCEGFKVWIPKSVIYMTKEVA